MLWCPFFLLSWTAPHQKSWIRPRLATTTIPTTTTTITTITPINVVACPEKLEWGGAQSNFPTRDHQNIFNLILI